MEDSSNTLTANETLKQNICAKETAGLFKIQGFNQQHTFELGPVPFVLEIAIVIIIGATQAPHTETPDGLQVSLLDAQRWRTRPSQRFHNSSCPDFLGPPQQRTPDPKLYEQ